MGITSSTQIPIVNLESSAFFCQHRPPIFNNKTFSLISISNDNDNKIILLNMYDGQYPIKYILYGKYVDKKEFIEMVEFLSEYFLNIIKSNTEQLEIFLKIRKELSILA